MIGWFKIGDRVICTEEFDGNKEIVGMTGTVRNIIRDEDGEAVVAVNFDWELPILHDCHGSCEKGHGWWLYESRLEAYVDQPQEQSKIEIPYTDLNI